MTMFKLLARAAGAGFIAADFAPGGGIIGVAVLGGLLDFCHWP